MPQDHDPFHVTGCMEVSAQTNSLPWTRRGSRRKVENNLNTVTDTRCDHRHRLDESSAIGLIRRGQRDDTQPSGAIPVDDVIAQAEDLARLRSRVYPGELALCFLRHLPQRST